MRTIYWPSVCLLLKMFVYTTNEVVKPLARLLLRGVFFFHFHLFRLLHPTLFPPPAPRVSLL